MGYNGNPDLVIEMSNKLVEIFGDIDLEVLKELFLEFMSGERKFQYIFNISDISIGLRDKGVKTIKDKKIESETGIDFTRFVH